MMRPVSFVSRIPRRRLLASGVVLLIASFSLHQVASAATPVKVTTTATKNQKFTAAVGDSYTSGTGAGGEGVCDASTTSAYPQVAAKAEGAITLNYACAGATLAAFNSTYNTRMAMIKSLDSLSGLKVDYVSMTIGGNDVGALQAIPTLLAGGSVTAFDTKVDALVPKLTTGYKQVRTAVPEADVYVLGYPNILPTSAAGYAACKNLSGITVKSPENATKALNDLNAGIKKAVAATKDTKVHYVPIDTFTGHDFCSTTPWANGISGSGALHPNVAGQTEMARVLEASVNGKPIATTTTVKPTTTTTAKPTTTTTAKPTTTSTKVPVTILATTTTTTSTTIATTPTTQFACTDRLVDVNATSTQPDKTTTTCYPVKPVKPITTTTTTTKVPVTVLESTTTTAKPTTTTTAKPTTTTTKVPVAVLGEDVTTTTAAPVAATAPALAFTGSNTMGMASMAMFLLGIGLAMMWARLVIRERRTA